jgi:hypothetical protein
LHRSIDPFKIEIIGDEKINFEVEATKRDTHAQKKYLKKTKKIQNGAGFRNLYFNKTLQFFCNIRYFMELIP